MYIANRVTREIYSTFDQINQIFRSFAFIQNKEEGEKIKREREKKNVKFSRSNDSNSIPLP